MILYCGLFQTEISSTMICLYIWKSSPGHLPAAEEPSHAAAPFLSPLSFSPSLYCSPSPSPHFHRLPGLGKHCSHTALCLAGWLGGPPQGKTLCLWSITPLMQKVCKSLEWREMIFLPYYFVRNHQGSARRGMEKIKIKKSDGYKELVLLGYLNFTHFQVLVT